MADEKVIGEMAPRYRTEIRKEAPYIVIKQEEPESGDDSYVSIHINALEEFFTLMSAAASAVKKDMQKVADTPTAAPK